MRRRLERALPLLVLLGFAATAILVNVLLAHAQAQGIEGLEDATANEVAAIARSQDQRLAGQFSGARELLVEGDGAIDFDLEVGSQRDRRTLETLLGDLTASLEFGYYLVDSDGVLTQGYLLEDEGAIGQPFDWPGFAGAASDPGFRGVVLPVDVGLTTGQPAYALAFPVPSTSGERGAFVIESPVGPDTDFNQEIEGLRRGDTGEYSFFDDHGTVIASNDLSLVGERIADEGMLTAPAGIDRVDGDIVALADVPTAGWRVAFRQDEDEFEQPLARPVESVGQILVLVLLGAGFVLTLLLSKRLRNAEEEQERLRRLSDSQQELISIVSHELRTPVAGVLGFLETSLDHWDAMDDLERRQAVGRAAANARRLQAMTRDVLDTQLVESGELVHVFDPVDVAEEVRVAVAASAELDPDRTIEVHLPEEPAWTRGDADRIQQVLANLLENARKNSPAVEPIAVTLAVRDDELELAVADRGAGIEPESLEHIFEKFVRGRDEGVTGTGLGLYIARRIVGAHHGRIWAESEAGEGATFRVRLPRSSAPIPSEPEVVNP